MSGLVLPMEWLSLGAQARFQSPTSNSPLLPAYQLVGQLLYSTEAEVWNLHGECLFPGLSC
jgi:hypothetical protein